MGDITPTWRPRDWIRPIAIGLAVREGTLLCAAVTRDDGTVTGWRPLGGGIKFGEQAADALVREFREELGARVLIERQVCVLENFFEHQGANGHELVFVFALALEDPGQAQAEAFLLDDEGFRAEARWIPLNRFRSGELRLLPEGLLSHI